MTKTVTLVAARMQEPASNYRGMKEKGLTLALLGCLSWLPLSSAAEAAPFQQYRNGACTSAAICNIDFSAVPDNKRLEITNVSCYLRTSGTHELRAMQLLVINDNATRSALTLLPRFVDDVSVPFESVYSANHTVFALAGAGQRFRAYAELPKGTFSQFACHISGQLQNAPSGPD